MNPQEIPPRPLFGCKVVCRFVEECSHPDECITLHPITPIEPWSKSYGDNER